MEDKKKEELEEVMNEIAFMYDYYFTDKYTKHGYLYFLTLRSLERIMRYLLKAVLLLYEYQNEIKETK